MTLPVSGAISFNAINVELGVAGTTQANINQATYRTLAGVPGSGTTISLNNFYGKSNRVAISRTFTANTANASQSLSAIAGYVAGASDITITINSGVYLYATSNANAGLTLTGGTTGDTLTIVNNGFIMGRGGDGAFSLSSPNTFVAATVGGSALSIPINATINNTNASAYIGGGGGAGGYGGVGGLGGGGAGGGSGGYFSSTQTQYPNGGSIGSAGANGVATPGNVVGRGGGGGRIFAGTGGAAVSSTATNSFGRGGGSGGSGGGSAATTSITTTSGAGGSANASGGNGSVTGPAAKTASVAAGGGGGWGASGGTGVSVSTGGTTNLPGTAGGRAVQLNGRTVTFTSGNTTRVYGAVS